MDKKTYKIKESELVEEIIDYVRQASQENLLDLYNYLFEMTGTTPMYYDDEIKWGK